jgi:hypothetical protein
LDAGDDKTIKSLNKKYQMIILDENSENRGILEYGALYEECPDTRMETVFPKINKYINSTNPPSAELILSRVSVLKQEGENR